MLINSNEEQSAALSSFQETCTRPLSRVPDEVRGCRTKDEMSEVSVWGGGQSTCDLLLSLILTIVGSKPKKTK